MEAGDQEEPGGEDPFYHDERTLGVIMIGPGFQIGKEKNGIELCAIHCYVSSGEPSQVP